MEKIDILKCNAECFGRIHIMVNTSNEKRKTKLLTPQADRKMLPVTSKNFEFEQIQSKN